MKMTWLHMLFCAVFVPSDGRAKSAQQLKMMVLLFLPLYFSWSQPSKKRAQMQAIWPSQIQDIQIIAFHITNQRSHSILCTPTNSTFMYSFQLRTRDFQGTFMDYYSAPRPRRSCFAHPNLYAEANFKAQLNSESPRCIIKGKKYSF